MEMPILTYDIFEYLYTIGVGISGIKKHSNGGSIRTISHPEGAFIFNTEPLSLWKLIRAHYSIIWVTGLQDTHKWRVVVSS